MYVITKHSRVLVRVLVDELQLWREIVEHKDRLMRVKRLALIRVKRLRPSNACLCYLFLICESYLDEGLYFYNSEVEIQLFLLYIVFCMEIVLRFLLSVFTISFFNIFYSYSSYVSVEDVSSGVVWEDAVDMLSWYASELAYQ